MLHSPLEQFCVHTIVGFKIWGYDLSFTNSSLIMLIALLIIVLFGFFSTYTRNGKMLDEGYNNKNIIPSRIGFISEKVYEFINNMLKDAVGGNVSMYVPFAFTLFMFIMITNLISIVPGSFTVMSQISITFFMAFFVFLGVTAIGFAKHGLHYFSLFVPQGVPMVLLPLIFVIELFTYFIRPISLSLRLAVNMTAGHIMMKVMASLAAISGVLGVLPFTLLVVLTGFEILVSILQAYIFTILSCIYLNDAVNLH